MEKEEKRWFCLGLFSWFTFRAEILLSNKILKMRSRRTIKKVLKNKEIEDQYNEFVKEYLAPVYHCKIKKLKEYNVERILMIRFAVEDFERVLKLGILEKKEKKGV